MQPGASLPLSSTDVLKQQKLNVKYIFSAERKSLFMEFTLETEMISPADRGSEYFCPFIVFTGQHDLYAVWF